VFELEAVVKYKMPAHQNQLLYFLSAGCFEFNFPSLAHKLRFVLILLDAQHKISWK